MVMFLHLQENRKKNKKKNNHIQWENVHHLVIWPVVILINLFGKGEKRELKTDDTPEIGICMSYKVKEKDVNADSVTETQFGLTITSLCQWIRLCIFSSCVCARVCVTVLHHCYDKPIGMSKRCFYMRS